MAFRVRLTVDVSFLEDVEDYIEGLESTVIAKGQAAADDIRAPLLDALGQYPPAPDYPEGEFPWTSEKQRRYVMMLLRRQAAERGDLTDLRYQRTGDLGDAWYLEVTTEGGRFRLEVGNRAQNERGDFIAQFVVGTLNQRSRAEALIPIQEFHADRWTPAVDTVNFYFGEAEEQFTDAIEEDFDSFVTTTARRRSRKR